MPTDSTGPDLPVNPSEPEGSQRKGVPDVAGVGNIPGLVSAQDTGYDGLIPGMAPVEGVACNVSPPDGSADYVAGGYLAGDTTKVDFGGMPGFVNASPFAKARFVVVVPSPPDEKDWNKLEDRRRELQRTAAEFVRFLDEPTPRVGTVLHDARAADVHNRMTWILEEYVQLTADRDAILEERARERQRRDVVLAKVATEQACERERARLDADEK